MSHEEDAERQLILTDKVCPWLFHAIEVHLDGAKTGEVTTLVTTPGEQTSDVARFVQNHGHAIDGVERRNGTVELRVRKQASSECDASSGCCPEGECR